MGLLFEERNEEFIFVDRVFNLFNRTFDYPIFPPNELIFSCEFMPAAIPAADPGADKREVALLLITAFLKNSGFESIMKPASINMEIASPITLSTNTPPSCR